MYIYRERQRDRERNRDHLSKMATKTLGMRSIYLYLLLFCFANPHPPYLHFSQVYQNQTQENEETLHKPNFMAFIKYLQLNYKSFYKDLENSTSPPPPQKKKKTSRKFICNHLENRDITLPFMETSYINNSIYLWSGII